MSPNLSNFNSFRGLIFISCIVLTACGGEQVPDKPGGMGRGGPVAVIATTIVAQVFTDEFTALGTAWSNESIEVTSRISSVVTRIAFEEGREVASGDLLVELDNRDLKASQTKAKATLKKISSQYERRKSLGTTKVVSQDELDELAADVQIATAELHIAEARLRDSFVRAPFAGTVGLRRISIGGLVGPDTIITTLDDVATLKLQFSVPEIFLGTLNTGMSIKATSSVYPDRHFSGEIQAIDSRVDPATRSIAVVARLPNTERLLRPGMFLTVVLQRERDNVLMVPEQSLVPSLGRQFVFVIKDNKAIKQEVQLGTRTPGFAEIRQGLKTGDMVVTEGTQKLRDGVPVQIVSGS